MAEPSHRRPVRNDPTGVRVALSLQARVNTGLRGGLSMAVRIFEIPDLHAVRLDDLADARTLAHRLARPQ
jgi:hypothetical protein